MDGDFSPSFEFVNEVIEREEEEDRGVTEEGPNKLGAEGRTDTLSGGPGCPNQTISDLAEDGQTGKMLVSMPYRTVTCPCSQVFCSIYEFEIHMERAHMGIDVKYTCDKCDRHYRGAHGAKIHRSLCKGKIVLPMVPTPWRCDACDMAFRSKSGLSQHKRHRHPALRNMERKTQYVRKSPQERPVYKATKLWSVEETRRLIELEAVFEGKTQINKLIAGELAGKSNKQVSDRRRTLQKAKTKISQETESEVGAADRETEPGLGVSEAVTNPESFWEFVTEAGKSVKGLSHQKTLQVLVDLLQEGQIEVACREVGEILADITPVTKPQPKRKSKKGTRAKTRRKSQTSAAAYRHAQQLFDTNKKSLVAEILEGAESSRCPLSVEAVYDAYKSRFETDSPEVDMSHFPPPDNGMDCDNILKPITGEEVYKAFMKTRPDSASGPDRIDMRSIRKWDPRGNTLAAVFNIFLLTGRVPDTIKANRSILLPKGGDRDDVGNWRPLTIGCMVLRLYTKVLAARFMEAIPLNPCQRGFMRGGSCSENVHLVEGLVRDAKRRSRPIAVCFLDLAKAFDTVSHKHVLAGLERFGASKHVTRIVEDLYEGASTRFTIPDGSTGEIVMKRGVKQGDPLSPVLFNIALDPLFCLVNKEGVAYELEDGTQVSIAGYADDTMVVSNNRDDLQANINLVEEFCRAAKLQLNARKSFAYTVTPVAKTYVVNCVDQLKIEGEAITWIQPGETAQYLGVAQSPWVKKVKDDPTEDLRSWCSKLGRAPLKGRQKLLLLIQHVLPKLRYRLANSDPSKVLLEGLDCVSRDYVRKWLNLPACVSSAFLHCSIRNGGVGLPCLTTEVPLDQIGSMTRLVGSQDALIRQQAKAIGMESVLEDTCRRWGMRRPAGKVKPLVREVRRERRKEWESLGSQGPQGPYWRGCKASNGWMRSDVLSESEHTVAIQLRTNTYPTREALWRGRSGGNVMCRRCGQSVETLGHITGQCLAVKGNRIKRHNKVCGILMSAAKGQKWGVMVEPHIKVDGRTYIPDLVFLRGDQVILVDPTVVWESKSTSLYDAAKAKVTKYTAIEKALKDLTGKSEITLFGFPVGGRGTWFPGNNKVLDVLGIHRSKAKYICLTVLGDTLKMLRVFMDQ